MPDQYEIVEVHSNVDRLSVSAVHRLFVDMIERTARAGAVWLHLIVPRGRSLSLERSISMDGPHDDPAGITAAVGIPPIMDAPDRMSKRPSPDFFSPVAGGLSSRDYPLFVDRGTGIFGPAHAPIHAHTGGAMKFEDADGSTIFRRTVEGQPAKHFMLDTFEEVRHAALPAEAERFREHVQHLYLESPHP